MHIGFKIKIFRSWLPFFRARGPDLLFAQRHLFGAGVRRGVEEGVRVAVLGATVVRQRGGRRRQPVHQGHRVDGFGNGTLSGNKFINNIICIENASNTMKLGYNKLGC